jgi:AcrR family transcriptional regulator
MPRKLLPERRRAILDAARDLFASKGYHETSIADVAAELRMGHGTFYRYFKNKRDIFAHVIDEIVGRIAGIAIAEAPSAPTSLAEFRAQVERIGRRLYQIFAEDPAAVRLVFHEVNGVDAAMRKRIDDAFEFFARFTAAYMKNGVDRGYLRRDLDVDTAARAMNAVVYEGIRRCAVATDFDREARRWIDITIQLQFESLAARS